MGQVCSEISYLQQEYCGEFALTDEHSPSHGKDQRACGADSGSSLSKVVRKPERWKLGLSDAGEAALNVLRTRFDVHRGVCWNLTHGKVVGEVFQSPPNKYFTSAKIDAENENVHSDFLPEKMGEIMSRAEEWVDFTSLSQPDGKFLKHMCKALKAIHDRGKPVTVRFLTGNIFGMATDNDALLELLINNPHYPEYRLPADSKLRIWVGSWRKNLSWNHSKILAVDGKYLFQGGHNVWDAHYLQKNPVRDMSMEAEGRVAHDGHVFANRMWDFIVTKDRESIIQSRVPDWVPVPTNSRIGITHWPDAVGEFVPMYEPPRDEVLPLAFAVAYDQGDIPMITCGRYGALHTDQEPANPSDAAFIAMLGSAKSSIKMSLQDLGPIAVPIAGHLTPVPGGVWPEEYLREIGRAIYERDVRVNILLSNPYSVPSNLSPLEANYGNGWTCEDVVAEIIHAIQELFPDYDDDSLRGHVMDRLKVAYVRSSCGESDWYEARKSGNHVKFFMIDDRCYYIGSQNLYIANLAEWGIIVDNEPQAQAMLEQYWRGCWASSYENVPESSRDVQVDAVLYKLDVRGRCHEFTKEELDQVVMAKQKSHGGIHHNTLRVWVKRASHVRNADGPFSGSSDSYVTLQVFDDAGQKIGRKHRTRVINNGKSTPHWNEQLTLEGLESPEAYTLRLKVLDRDFFNPDDLLGRVDVKLGLLHKTTEFQDFELTVAHGRGIRKDTKLVIAFNTDGCWGC